MMIVHVLTVLWAVCRITVQYKQAQRMRIKSVPRAQVLLQALLIVEVHY